MMRTSLEKKKGAHMPLKAMILDTPLEKPARSVIRVARWPKRKLRPIAHKFNKTLKYVRIALAAEKNRDVGDIDVVICSPGGVATTMLLQHFGCFVNTNDKDDLDTLKHVPDPELLLSDPKFRGRILYVYGDIRSTVASIDRRGWVRRQGAKLGSLWAVLLPQGAARHAFARAVSAQIEKFLNCKDQRLKAIRFEDIWESPQELSDFLGVEDPKFLENYPQRKRRQTEQLDNRLHSEQGQHQRS